MRSRGFHERVTPIDLAVRRRCLLPTASVIADEEEARRALVVEKQHVEETLRMGIAEGRTFDIRVLTELPTQLELNERTNPITGAYGELLVWTLRSRPLVIASVYQYYSPDQYQLQALQNGEVVWSVPIALGDQKLLRTEGYTTFFRYS